MAIAKAQKYKGFDGKNTSSVEPLRDVTISMKLCDVPVSAISLNVTKLPRLCVAIRRPGTQTWQQTEIDPDFLEGHSIKEARLIVQQAGLAAALSINNQYDSNIDDSVVYRVVGELFDAHMRGGL